MEGKRKVIIGVIVIFLIIIVIQLTNNSRRDKALEGGVHVTGLVKTVYMPRGGKLVVVEYTYEEKIYTDQIHLTAGDSTKEGDSVLLQIPKSGPGKYTKLIRRITRK